MNFKEIREKASISQMELSYASNLTRWAIHMVENGRRADYSDDDHDKYKRALLKVIDSKIKELSLLDLKTREL